MQNTTKPYITPILTFFIMAILVISGPAQALTLIITSLPETAAQGSEINFMLDIDIASGERIPIKDIMLSINSTECRYDLAGTLNTSSPQSCSAFTLTRTQNAPYTEGQRHGYDNNTTQDYGYGYGYGYGSTPASITYNITWNTTDYSVGTHTIQAYAIANSTDETHIYKSEQKTIRLDSDGQTTSSGSGSTSISNIKTDTTTIQIKETPKLEIRSIILPEIMHPGIQHMITITIKNTGTEACEVHANLDLLDQPQTGAQDIAPGEESTYIYTTTPQASDLGDHIAKITITSGAKHIERHIPFTVEDTHSNESNDTPPTTGEPSVVYDEKAGTLTIKGCLQKNIETPMITINNKTKIDIRKDTDNCFHTILSTSMLPPGTHTLTITDKENMLYKQSFTIPTKTQNPNTPTGAVTSTSADTNSKTILFLLALLTIILLAAKLKKIKKT